MNAVGGIFVAVALIFGSGYALNRIYVATRYLALERIHRGMPHLSEFTSRMTCSKISNEGVLVPARCGKRRTANRK